MKRKRENTNEKKKDDSTPIIAAQPVEKDETESCPSYGSQNYWEQRYANEKASSDDVDGGKKGRDEAGFSWYFTYQELKPLLLPICIGRTDDDDDWSDIEETEELLVEDDESDDEDPEKHALHGEEEETDEDVDEQVEGHEDAKKKDEPNENDEEFSDENEICSNEDEEDMERFQISDLPRSIIEIGCGDVPLGKELCENLLQIQKKTGIDALRAVRRIVCFDYSKTVVDLLHEKQKGEGISEKNRLMVEYKVHDARNVPYEDKEFHVVIDKGTLDAMLSDKAHGKNNCIKIISESARILALNGYIFIVSHLNANSSEGLAWTQEVLIAGLKGGDNVNDWRIEVHGNDVDDDDGVSSDGEINIEEKELNGENEDDDDGKSYGPAVYIIRKVAVSNEEREERNKTQKTSRADMKFFGY